MTSESYARDEAWTPLPPNARKWEASDPSSPSQPWTASQPSSSIAHAQGDTPSSPDLADFAEEAALSSPAPTLSFPTERPPTPRLSADHIWGVREDWGERAGDWGRGAALHSRPTSSPPGRQPAVRGETWAEEPTRSQAGGDDSSRKGER